MSIFANLQHLFLSLAGKDKKKAEKKLKTPEQASPEKKEVQPSVSPLPVQKRESDSLDHKKIEKNSPSKEKKAEEKPVRKPLAGKQTKSRTGIPIIKKNADLEQMMRGSRTSSPEAREKLSAHQKRKKTLSPKRPSASRKNRHGIPILRDGVDFDLVFHSKEEKSGAEENFAALLEKSLGSRELDALLHEKKQKPPSPPLPLKERIARYPAPEETLDLHGFSGIQASLKTEVFLEGAKAKGLFTVRIITGKGLHSDGPAILPGIVEQKILELKKKEVILAHKWENKSGKPHGSVQVFLQHFK